MIKVPFIKQFLAGAILVGTFASCQGPGDFLEPQPVDEITDDLAIQDAASAEGAILGAYGSLQSGDYYGWMYQAGVALASDCAYHSGSFPSYREMDGNNIFSTNTNVLDIWSQGFITLYRANIVLERVPGIPDANITAARRDQILGEAYFLRALAHFDLSRYFGDVPIVTSTSVDANKSLSRSAVADVYAQINSDLAQAATLLANYQPASLEEQKSRASVDAVNALRARVALYAGDYATAASAASSVIDAGYSLESDYGNLLDPANTRSSEIIFQVYADVNDGNSLAFWTFPSTDGGRWEIAPAPDFVFALEDSRDQGDSRYAALIAQHPTEFGEYYFTKFRDIQQGTDMPMVFRLGEMYLIRAEARAQQGDVSGSMSDLNMIRSRAGLSDASASSTADALMMIEQERFIELALEGHRYFDLRRTGRIDEVMSLINPDGWNSTDAYFPIPQREVDLNNNLTQNPGY